eukprot:2809830-Pleurochrysis_carterae.AAC.3
MIAEGQEVALPCHCQCCEQQECHSRGDRACQQRHQLHLGLPLGVRCASPPALLPRRFQRSSAGRYPARRIVA